MVNLGFRAHDFGKFTSIDELADTAVQYRKNPCLHFAPYKVLPDSPRPMTEQWADNVYKSLNAKGITIAILGCYINPMHPDTEVQKQQLLSFENGIDVAKNLGNPIVATETGSVDPNNVRCQETYTEKSFTHFLKNVEMLLTHAEKSNVTMALEAVSDKNTIDTPQRMLKVMETFKSKNLRVLFDAVNILPIHGLSDYSEWYNEALDMLSPYICAMHLKDFNWIESSKEYPNEKGPVKNGNIPIGEGLFPWKEIFALYKKYNLTDVPMTLENFKAPTLLQSLEYVKNCFL